MSNLESILKMGRILVLRKIGFLELKLNKIEKKMTFENILSLKAFYNELFSSKMHDG